MQTGQLAAANAKLEQQAGQLAASDAKAGKLDRTDEKLEQHADRTDAKLKAQVGQLETLTSTFTRSCGG